MTVRLPAKLGAGNLPTGMTTAEKDQFVKRGVYLYGAQSGSGSYQNKPPIFAEWGSSNGTLNQMHNNRDIAGAAVTNVSSFQNAAGNAIVDAGVTSVEDHISIVPGTNTTEGSGHDVGEDVADTNNSAFPLYLDGNNNLVAMSKADFLDTFVFPTIEELIDGSDHDGTFKIDQGNLVGEVFNHSPVSVGNPVFIDSRFDAALLHSFAASGTTATHPGTNLPNWASRLTGANVDQGTGYANNIRYYLHVANSGNSYGTPSHALPLKYAGNGVVQEYTQAEIDDIFRKLIKFTAINTSPYRIRYEIRLSAGNHISNGTVISFPADPSYAGGWNSKGETMTDTTLNGSVQLRKQFTADDYASQMMPTGSPEVEAAYQLMIYRI